MIHLNNLCLSFGSQKVFDQLAYSVAPDQRLGLVGRNGSGKSTLLKVIGGMIPLDSGSVSVSGNCTIAYMPQELVISSTRSIFDEAFASYHTIGKLWEKIQELEPKIAQGCSDAVQEYGEISFQYQQLLPDQARLETKNMLLGLGFKEAQLNESVQTLSVGWQMRVVLAKLLLQKADFYLFDEPTNHLDIVAKDWFLSFLADAPFGFILVCHDKYFLDEQCSTILELDRGKGSLFYGNYSDYEREKAEQIEALMAAKRQQDRELAHKQQLIDKFKAKASKAKMAKSMEKALDKMEIIEVPQEAKQVRFRFPEPKRSGRIVLEAHDLGFKYDDKQIFKGVELKIERGEKVALIAPNGVGKTTLFNVLSGKFKPTQGIYQMGSEVYATIFEQEQTKVLNPNNTVIQEVFEHVPNKTEQEIRMFLGAFLFGKEEIQKKTKVLSGGERNRLSMVKVLLQDANFLLLDEPTNHLDIPSKEILLKALQEYKGTILFVSHDHDFVNHLASSILELTPDGVLRYHGNYESFLAQKRLANKQTAFAKATAPSVSAAADQDAKSSRKDLNRIERTMAKLESDKEKIQASFADLEYGTPEFDKAQEKLEAITKELKALTKEWEALTA